MPPTALTMKFGKQVGLLLLPAQLRFHVQVEELRNRSTSAIRQLTAWRSESVCRSAAEIGLM